jgi:hypothetical protein
MSLTVDHTGTKLPVDAGKKTKVMIDWLVSPVSGNP